MKLKKCEIVALHVHRSNIIHQKLIGDFSRRHLIRKYQYYNLFIIENNEKHGSLVTDVWDEQCQPT